MQENGAGTRKYITGKRCIFADESIIGKDMTGEEIIEELRHLGNEEKAVHLSRFFKTGKGEYGEGDRFLGVKVPEQREVARKYGQADWQTLETLVASPWHEARLTGLLILVQRFGQARGNEAERALCVAFYLGHTACINNWDLVDLTCYKLLGVWLEDKDRSVLYRLADSDNLWEQRIGIVTCMHFVRRGDFRDCLAIADKLLRHPHDLIHKAVGWLLREVGKRDKGVLVDFLAPRVQVMPRTMLRYAIERFPEEERRKYLER